MLLKTIIIFSIVIATLWSSNNDFDKVVKNELEVVKNSEEVNTYYGYLNIPSINMYLGFFNEDSKLNDVSKNVTIIPTNINNTYLLAAHSGTGPLAYFNDLRKLKVDDEIYLEFKDKVNKYKVKRIRKEIKDGSISIPKKENMLILTTCDQIVKGYQLIVEAKLV